MPQNLDIMKEKENKGFFSFFQRSKKKRDQVCIFLCNLFLICVYFLSWIYISILPFYFLLDCKCPCNPASK